MRGRRELMTHLFMVAAPFLMLGAITAAWFVQSDTVRTGQMSFASQDTGPGAVLYPGEVDGAKRLSDGGSLTNTVAWLDARKPEQSDITIQSFLPGRCEYYLLLANDPVSVTLTNVSFTGPDGAGASLGGDVPLAQCVGIYLLPVTLEPDVKPADLPPAAHTVTLDRLSAGGMLADAVLSGATAGEDVLLTAQTPEGAAVTEPASAYILALFCDPVYLQDDARQPVNELPGTLTFSLAFRTKEA